MRLSSTISLHAGGSGSGCQGPNCGRNASLKEAYELHDQVRGWSGQPSRNEYFRRERAIDSIKALLQLNLGKNALVKEAYQKAVARIGDAKGHALQGRFGAAMVAHETALMHFHAILQTLTKGKMSGKEMKAGGPGSGCSGPNCGRPRTSFEEHDRVALNVITRAFDEKRLMYRKFPIGTEATVQSVTKAFGTNPEMVTISSKRMSGVTLPAHELTFLKSGKAKNIDVQPVPKRYIKLEMQLRNGAKYTIIKPEKEGQKRGPQDPLNKKSRFKGEFDKPEKFYGASDKMARNLKSWVTEATRDERGTTLFIHRYSDAVGRPTKVVIQEHPWAGEHYRLGTPIQFEFKNAGKAMGLLKERYGISFKMRDWRG